ALDVRRDAHRDERLPRHAIERVERRRELGSVREAFVRILLQTPNEDLLDLRPEVRDERPNRLRLPLRDREQERDRIVAVERATSREHLVEERAEREDVAP